MIAQFGRMRRLIDRSVLWQSGGVVLLTLVGAALEAASVGLLFPFMRIIGDESALSEFGPLAAWLEAVGATQHRDVLLILTCGLMGFFVLKNVLLIFIQYVQQRFISTNEARLAVRLFRAYLDGEYALHLQQNSANLIRNVNNAVPTVFRSVIMGFINLFSEIVLGAAIGIILFVAQPGLTAVVVLFLGGGLAVFYAFSRTRLSNYGRIEQVLMGDILKHLQQGLHSIKESKVLGRVGFMVDVFTVPRRRLADVMVAKNVIVNASRMWIESISVLTILSILAVALLRGEEISAIIAVLVLYAAAAFRLIPSMNRIIIALNGIRNGQHALDLISHDVAAFEMASENAPDSPVNAVPLESGIALEDVSFRYDNTTFDVLKGVTLQIKKGQSVGIVGPSGAGKSTLIDLLLGLLKPTRGRIVVDDRDIRGELAAWRARVGYVPQSIYISDDTIRGNITLGVPPDETDADRLAKALSLAQLDHLIDSLPDGVETVIGERGARLSGGQRQRVGIARALYGDPDVLVFDEATSSLDTETEHEITQAIERLSGIKTILIVAHRLSTVRNCDRIVLLDSGQVSAVGSFEGLIDSNTGFRALVERAKIN